MRFRLSFLLPCLALASLPLDCSAVAQGLPAQTGADGPFLGIGLGQTAHGADLTVSVVGAGSASLDGISLDAPALDIAAGWMAAHGRWHWGVRGEAGFVLEDARATGAFEDGPAGSVSLRRDDSLHLGLQAGWAPGEGSLVYGSAGWTWTALTAQGEIAGTGFSRSLDQDGFTLGGGLGVAVSRHAMLVLDIRREFLNARTLMPHPDTQLEIGSHASGARLGLVWRFGG